MITGNEKHYISIYICTCAVEGWSRQTVFISININIRKNIFVYNMYVIRQVLINVNITQNIFISINFCGEVEWKYRLHEKMKH